MESKSGAKWFLRRRQPSRRSALLFVPGGVSGDGKYYLGQDIGKHRDMMELLQHQPVPDLVLEFRSLSLWMLVGIKGPTLPVKFG